MEKNYTNETYAVTALSGPMGNKPPTHRGAAAPSSLKEGAPVGPDQSTNAIGHVFEAGGRRALNSIDIVEHRLHVAGTWFATSGYANRYDRQKGGIAYRHI